jgi:hypothetical protein
VPRTRLQTGSVSLAAGGELSCREECGVTPVMVTAGLTGHDDLDAADSSEGNQVTDTLEQVSALLHEAGETHHRVFRIVDGTDDDWASWYAQWLIDLSELPDLLGASPVRSELIYLLVSLDKQFTAEAPGEPWETYYARQILLHFRPRGS